MKRDFVTIISIFILFIRYRYISVVSREYRDDRWNAPLCLMKAICCKMSNHFSFFIYPALVDSTLRIWQIWSLGMHRSRWIFDNWQVDFVCSRYKALGAPIQSTTTCEGQVTRHTTARLIVVSWSRSLLFSLKGISVVIVLSVSIDFHFSLSAVSFVTVSRSIWSDGSLSSVCYA